MNYLHWKHESTAEGGQFCFTVTRAGRLLSVTEWIHAAPIDTARGAGALDALLVRLGCKGFSEEETSLMVTDRAIATLAHEQKDALSALGLPDRFPFRLQLTEESALGLPNFRIRTRFFDGKHPLLGIERRGVLLEQAGRHYLLPEPLYRLLEGVSRLNARLPELRGADQFLAWRELCLPEWPAEASKKGQLARIEIVYADSFTLDVESDASFHPRLRYRPPETLDQLEPDKSRDALSSGAGARFLHRFAEGSQVRSSYKLGKECYLFLSPQLKKALEVVQQKRRANANQRLAFIANPAAALVEAFSEPEEEEKEGSSTLAEVFEEEPRFLSARIKYLGVWKPKAGIYTPPAGMAWFPPETVLIPADETMLRVPTSDLSKRADQIQAARQTGEQHIEIDGQQVTVSSGLEAQFRRAAEEYETKTNIGRTSYPTGKNFSSLGGVTVRSRPEQQIADALEQKGLCYAYERRLEAGGKHYDPDFTIPYGDRIYYWEHLGMLSQEDYRRRWEDEKAPWYRRHFPEQLITTQGSAQLNSEIEYVLAQYFPEGSKRQPTDWDPQPSLSSLQLVPVLHDNLDELGYEAEVLQGSAFGEEAILPQTLCSELKAHQLCGLTQLQKLYKAGLPGMLLADDMGLGKTLQALCFMRWLMEETSSQKPLLVVAPSTLLSNWEAEAQRHFSGGIGEAYHARGQQLCADRMRAASWVLTTYQTLRDRVLEFTGLPWQLVVFDECQAIKNPATRVTEMAKSLKARFTLMMTGTPIENSFDEFWCLMDTTYPGYLGELKAFRKQFSDPFEAGDSSPIKQLRMMLERKGLLLRRMKNSTLKGLPKITIRCYPQTMSVRQATAYDEALRDALEKREQGSALEALHKLRRVSLIVDPLDKAGISADFMQEHARFKALMTILQALPANEKALIFCEWLDIQGALQSYLARCFPELGNPLLINGRVKLSEREQRVYIFQKDRHRRVMILSQKVGGVGLTLTAANHVIHLTRWWNPAVEDQCTDRVYRIGQQRDVTVHLPQAIHPKLGDEDSFDSKLHKLLDRKRIRAEQLIPMNAGNAEVLDTFLADPRPITSPATRMPSAASLRSQSALESQTVRRS